MRLVVFGSTGRVGSRIVAQALAAGHEVTAYARPPSKIAKMSSPRLKVVEADLSDLDAIDRAIVGADAVISALGPSDTPVGTQLSDGMRNIVHAMERSGVRRLVMLSTASVRDPHDRFDLIYNALVSLIRLRFRDAYREVLRMADAVRGSSTDWTLVRIGLLSDRRAAPVRTGPYGHRSVGLWVSIASVATFMLQLATNPAYIRESPAISN